MFASGRSVSGAPDRRHEERADTGVRLYQRGSVFKEIPVSLLQRLISQVFFDIMYERKEIIILHKIILWQYYVSPAFPETCKTFKASFKMLIWSQKHFSCFKLTILPPSALLILCFCIFWLPSIPPSLSASFWRTTPSSTYQRWLTSWAVATSSPRSSCPGSLWTRPRTCRRSWRTRSASKRTAKSGAPFYFFYFLFFFTFSPCFRSARTSWCCASGSCLSSGTCRPTPTGPTSSTTRRRTGWVRHESQSLNRLFSRLIRGLWLTVSSPQISLLDFGATRSFDQSFTDVYIEVNSARK